MPGRIRDADIVTVRERADIADVIGERIQLKSAGGGRLKGLCPFHEEKSPSFSVNPALGFYHCLAGETRVLTWEGTREIRDLAGGVHRVLGRNGQWTDAPFKSYGQQQLYEITLARNGQTKVIRATSGHRWFVGSGWTETVTTALEPGHVLASVRAPVLQLAGRRSRTTDAHVGTPWSPSSWIVVGVRATSVVDEVFCAEVEEGHAFVLEDSIVSGNCFGCGESGDVISFLRNSEHLSFVEAIELLAGRYGVQLTYEQGSAAAGRQSSQRTRIVEANKVAQAFFAQALATPGAAAARTFLAERGFDRQVALDYGVGFAPEGWDILVKHLRSKGFTEQELTVSGLASEGRKGPIDRFRNRLVWPIREMTGEIVGFGARKLSTDPHDDSPKYLNTPETPLYRKSHVLYGLDLAKQQIARKRQAVVVEGYTDVMACHLAGVPTAVATCGTAFGGDHIGLLRRLLMDSGALVGEVIFLFDGDAAGQKAALKAFEDDQKFVTQMFIAISPGGMDPCELRLAKGDAAVKDLVASRVPLVSFALRSMLAKYDLETAEGRVQALAATAPLVAKIKDEALRPEYARLLSGWLGMEADIVMARVGESLGRDPRGPRRRPAPQLDSATVAVEREAIKLAVQSPVLVAPLFDAIDEQAWTSEPLRILRAIIAKIGGVSGQVSGEAWVTRLREAADEDVVRSLITQLAVEPMRSDLEPDDRYAGAVLARLQEFALSRRIAELKPALQRVNAVEEPDRYNAMFTELISLEQTMRSVRERGLSDL